MRSFAMKKPSQCYYKTLNISTKASQKEIKESYYALAKKLHPDSHLKDDPVNFPEHQHEHFKLVTEAYFVLGNEERKREYDKQILGTEFVDKEYKFYDPSLKRGENEDKEMENRDQTSRNVAEKLKKYKDYSDFLKNYEEHRLKHDYRSKMRTEGFEEYNYKYGLNYNYIKRAAEEHKDKYNTYRKEDLDRHYDTKENHEYYNKPVIERMKIQAAPTFKKMFTDLFSSRKEDENENPRPAA